MRGRHLALILSAMIVAAGAVYLVVELRAAGPAATRAVPSAAAPTSAQPEVGARQDRRPVTAAAARRPDGQTGGHATGTAATASSAPPRTPQDEPGNEPLSSIPRIASANRPAIAAIRDTMRPQKRHPASLRFQDRQAGDASLTSIEDALAREDFAAAREEGLRILGRDPASVPRAVQIVVEASCGLGEVDAAAKLSANLSGGELAAVRQRCAAHGVTLP